MSHRANDSSTAWSGSKPQRAAVACKSCNSRKIRCSFVFSGNPCTNCAADGIYCEIAKRKKRANPYQLESNELSLPQTSVTKKPRQDHLDSEATDPYLLHVNVPHQLNSRPDSSAPELSRNNLQNFANVRSRWSSHLMGSLPSPSSQSDLQSSYHATSEAFAEPSMMSQFETRENTADYGITAMERSNLYYLGDDRGPRGFILNLLQGQADENRHVSLPMLMKTLIPAEDKYLEHREALSLPPSKIQDALIRCYFHYVHPFAPILDVDDFLCRYKAGNMSFLLLWSVFTAAGNFIDEKTISDEFGLSRMDFKQAMFQRAKALYDLEYEKDTICLIQSVYLMSYWVSDVNALTGSWHWLGTAISLAYSLGLHRLSSYRRRHHEAPVSLLERIWWCIHCREVWSSVAYGRPLRIHLDDVNTALPTETNATSCFAQHGNGIIGSHLPEAIGAVSRVWSCLIRLTVVLAKILTTSYTAQCSNLTEEQLKQTEREIRNCIQGLPSDNQKSQIVKIHTTQIRLYHEATIIILYRPGINKKQGQPFVDDTKSLEKLCLRNMRSAALRATHLINILMADGFAANAHVLTIIAIVPPMQMHLYDLLSGSSTTRQAGEHNLQLCMVLLHHLRRAHASADATCNVFEKAFKKIKLKQDFNMSDELVSFSTHESGPFLDEGFWRGSDNIFGFLNATTLFYNEKSPGAG